MNAKNLQFLIKWTRPRTMLAIGEVLMAVSLVHRPSAGAPFNLWGINGSWWFTSWFIAGAVLAVLSRRARDFEWRTILYFFASLPFLGYTLSTLYLFVVVRGLDSPTVSLTVVVIYAGMYLMLLVNYMLVAQLELVMLNGIHDDT